MKVVSVVGARPNFVKLAPLSPQIRRHCRELIIHTGQHYDYLMDRIFFDELGIPAPDYHLGVGSGPHGAQTGAMLGKIEEILCAEDPDTVIVFGDTNSTLAGALASVKLHIPVAHVEAGLRSFDRQMPEEVNRVLVDHSASLLFCPTPTAVENLAHEGIRAGVFYTGDVMEDILGQCLRIAEGQSRIHAHLGIVPGEYCLATVHRAENTDNDTRLRSIIAAFGDLGETLVFPCHPRTAKRLESLGLNCTLPETVHIIPPVGYLDMLMLERHARVILTDSGGVQKEAFLLGVPCVTLRDTTEWVETVRDGWNVLAGADTATILHHVRSIGPARKKPARRKTGASRRIAERICSDSLGTSPLKR